MVGRILFVLLFIGLVSDSKASELKDERLLAESLEKILSEPEVQATFFGGHFLKRWLPSSKMEEIERSAMPTPIMNREDFVQAPEIESKEMESRSLEAGERKIMDTVESIEIKVHAIERWKLKSKSDVHEKNNDSGTIYEELVARFRQEILRLEKMLEESRALHESVIGEKQHAESSYSQLGGRYEGLSKQLQEVSFQMKQTQQEAQLLSKKMDELKKEHEVRMKELERAHKRRQDLLEDENRQLRKEKEHAATLRENALRVLAIAEAKLERLENKELQETFIKEISKNPTAQPIFTMVCNALLKERGEL